MQLIPHSLFGRLVLVLLAGLVVAQFLSTTISLSERDRALFSFSDEQWAQRDAAAVELLNSVTPEEQQRIASILTTPRLFVSVSSDTPVAGKADEQAADFQKLLQKLLGPERQVRVVVAQITPAQVAQARAVQPGSGPVDVPRQHSITEVRLDNGQWVSFDHPRPWHVSDRPWRLLLSLAVLLVSVILLSLLAVRWVTRPLTTLSIAASELGRDLRRAPMPETGPTEVRGAARAFNDMQTRLVNYIEDRTRLLTAISHDLKTPITRMRLRAEMLEDESLKEKIVRDLQEMENMTNATLDFLRGLEVSEAPQSVDLMALLESLQQDAVETGRNVSLQGSISKEYNGRPLALRRCLDNLVNNAVRYGKRAMISVEDDGNAVIIRVRDAGIGIPESMLEKVFEPYYRLEEARSQAGGGTGLGLGIARNIATLHGGTLVLRNHPEGGLEVVLTLPRRHDFRS
ncbi:MAG: HAMP domain-containing protein [Gammaproteobacteria bacterium]|nr:HAMP domain-containing protein [Gammaproteobacteria bacterium]